MAIQNIMRKTGESQNERFDKYVRDFQKSYQKVYEIYLDALNRYSVASLAPRKTTPKVS